MENYEEFKTAENIPGKNSGGVISHAFEIYKNTFGYPLVAVLFLGIIIVILFFVTGVGATFMGIIQESQSGKTMSYSEMNEIMYGETSFLKFAGIIILAYILLFSPVVIGTIYLAHKKNTNQQIRFSDLFIGFKQNYLKIVLYGLLMSLVSAVCSQIFFYLPQQIPFVTIVLQHLPEVFIMPFFFLGFPFLLFQNVSVAGAVKKSFETAKDNYSVFLLINLLAYLCSLLGVLGCGICVIFTFMFYYSVMYSAYCAYVELPKQSIKINN